MIIFRPHRPGLAEPMKEAAIFQDEELMLSHIVQINTDSRTGPAFRQEDIYIVDEPTEEMETGWKDARPVMVKQYGDDVFSGPRCVGYCATKFPRE